MATKDYPTIEIFGLYKHFKIGNQNRAILKNINLQLFHSDFTIIYGPSGCGKSTLLHVIAGLEEPTGGSLFINETNIYSYNEDERAFFRSNNLGIVYQLPYWVKSLDVLDNVALPLLIQGLSMKESYQKASASISQLGLTEFEKYIPTELSGGQQQKLSLARALVTEPEIIIADEPTGNLDSKSASDVMHLFKYLHEELKKSIIMVTHNMSYLGYATKVVAMKDGEIIRESKSDDLRSIVKSAQQLMIS